MNNIPLMIFAVSTTLLACEYGSILCGIAAFISTLTYLTKEIDR